MTTPDGVQIADDEITGIRLTGGSGEGYDEVLTAPALAFAEFLALPAYARMA